MFLVLDRFTSPSFTDLSLMRSTKPVATWDNGSRAKLRVINSVTETWGAPHAADCMLYYSQNRSPTVPRLFRREGHMDNLNTWDR